MLTPYVKLFLLLQTTVIANELCNDDKWSIVNGNWNYSNSTCTLQSLNKYYNDTILIWFGNSSDSFPWTSYNKDYSHKLFSVELTFSVNLDASQYNRNEVDKLQTGIIWYTSRVTDKHNNIDAYFYGVRCINGETRLGRIQNSWTQLTDSDTTVSPQKFGIGNVSHILKVKVISSIYQFYLDNEFQFEWIDTVFDHGTIGIRSKYCPATYYSLHMNVYNASNINITYNDIVYCNDSFTDEKIKHKLSYYKLVITDTKQMEFKFYGDLSGLQFHLFNDNFDIIIHCEEVTNCNEIFGTILTPGNYTIVTGSPDAAINNVPYNASILCHPPPTKSDADILIWTIVGVCCGVIILIILLVIFYIKKYKNNDESKYITNALGVIITIGKYDECSSNDDIKCNIADLDMLHHDYTNLSNLFNSLNYKCIPQKQKLHWTDEEIKDFLKNDIGKELFVDIIGKELLKYDALIVCVSSHGIKHNIITSDHKTIENDYFHRIISQKYPSIRNIPRIFIFDSCQGDDQFKADISVPQISKHTSVADIRDEGTGWIQNTKNQDYNLVTVYATNNGFQAKANLKIGSYLIYNFVTKMMKNLQKNESQTLVTIFDEIEQKLHDDGKQKPTTIFNTGSHTRDLQFKINQYNSNKITESNNFGNHVSDVSEDKDMNVEQKGLLQTGTI